MIDANSMVYLSFEKKKKKQEKIFIMLILSH